MEIDPSWPLPVPEELRPLMARGRRLAHGAGDRAHLDVLLEIALEAGQPDEVLKWYDRMRPSRVRDGLPTALGSHADRVAAAVATTHPERALAIYEACLEAQLPNASYSAYEAAVGYLKKLRPIDEALGRPDAWTARLAAIRERYRNRPRFMELLDALEGRTIVQTARTRKHRS